MSPVTHSVFKRAERCFYNVALWLCVFRADETVDTVFFELKEFHIPAPH